MSPRIEIAHAEIREFCRRNHIRRLALFGSVLREDFTEDSDVDVLVEFVPGHVPGLAFFRLERELSGILGREVELHTPDFLSPLFRDQVLEEAQVQYDAAWTQIVTILRAMELEGEAPRWMHMPLPGFAGTTPLELVEDGRGQELVGRLIANATGNVGS